MKKPAAPTGAQAGFSSTDNAPHSTSATPKFLGTANPRAMRLLHLLLDSSSVSARDICHVVGCSNAPALVQYVRGLGLGAAHLPCERIEVRDRDGRVCRPGRYHLTREGRQAVHEWLQALRSEG